MGHDLLLTQLLPDDPRMAEDVGPLMRALRPDLGQRAFTRFAAEAHTQGLVFTAAYDATGRCLAVSTHRILATSRGRVLFVDDLVTEPAHRARGVGALLVQELTALARAAGCARLELDSGVTNHAAHRFYHARRMDVVAMHFALDVGRL